MSVTLILHSKIKTIKTIRKDIRSQEEVGNISVSDELIVDDCQFFNPFKSYA